MAPSVTKHCLTEAPCTVSVTQGRVVLTGEESQENIQEESLEKIQEESQHKEKELEETEELVETLEKQLYIGKKVYTVTVIRPTD